MTPPNPTRQYVPDEDPIIGAGDVIAEESLQNFLILHLEEAHQSIDNALDFRGIGV